MWRSRKDLLIYFVAPVPDIVLHMALGTQWISAEQRNEWMNDTSSLCASGEFCNKATQCVSHFITLFFISSSDSLPFDRLTLRVLTRKLVFVSESVTPWCDFLEVRGFVPDRIPDPAQKMAFLGGYTSPYHVSHWLSMLPLIWKPAGNNSDSRHSFFSCEWIHSSWLFCTILESS